MQRTVGKIAGPSFDVYVVIKIKCLQVFLGIPDKHRAKKNSAMPSFLFQLDQPL
jgi:hypothetical protein